MAQNVRLPRWFPYQPVGELPYPAHRVPSEDTHGAFREAILLGGFQVSAKIRARFGHQNVPYVAAQALRGQEAKRLGGGGVDGKQFAVTIMGTNQRRRAFK